MSEKEMMAWDMYFGSVVAFAMHPGALAKDPMTPEKLEDLAKLADLMIVERAKRVKD